MWLNQWCWIKQTCLYLCVCLCNLVIHCLIQLIQGNISCITLFNFLFEFDVLLKHNSLVCTAILYSEVKSVTHSYRTLIMWGKCIIHEVSFIQFTTSSGMFVIQEAANLWADYIIAGKKHVWLFLTEFY